MAWPVPIRTHPGAHRDRDAPPFTCPQYRRRLRRSIVCSPSLSCLAPRLPHSGRPGSISRTVKKRRSARYCAQQALELVPCRRTPWCSTHQSSRPPVSSLPPPVTNHAHHTGSQAGLSCSASPCRGVLEGLREGSAGVDARLPLGVAVRARASKFSSAKPIDRLSCAAGADRVARRRGHALRAVWYTPSILDDLKVDVWRRLGHLLAQNLLAHGLAAAAVGELRAGWAWSARTLTCDRTLRAELPSWKLTLRPARRALHAIDRRPAPSQRWCGW